MTMDFVPHKRLQLYGGRSHPELAAEIAAHLGIEVGDANLVQFASGEIFCTFSESVRGADVFILQTHGSLINEWIMEQLIMIDAAKRGSAKRITAVCPYFGYGRQDRKAEGREPISAKLVADMLTTAGADRIVSVDLHAGQIQGFFDGPWDHLTALPLFIAYLQEHAPADAVLVAADPGRGKLVERYSGHLHRDIAIIHKRHVKGEINAVEAKYIMGDVAGRTCIILEDMIDTAGSVCAAAEILLEHGAADVWVLATHGILSGPAIDRLKNSAFSRVVITNTLPLASEKQIDKIEVLSASPMIASAISAVFEDESVSELFGGENQY